MHFSQPAQPHHHWAQGRRYRQCVIRTNFPLDVALLGPSLGAFWCVNYGLAMPLYFQTTEIRFNNYGRFSRFLSVIGPYHRQHVTRISLNSCLLNSSVDYEDFSAEVGDRTVLEALKLLRGCVALRHLKIIMFASKSHMAETSESFQAILKIRNLQSLDIYDYCSRNDLRAPMFLEFHEHAKQALQVLKQPRRAADVEEREKEGIFSMAIPRTFFGPINKPVVGDWFNVRESEAKNKFFENGAPECTVLKDLKREKKLVEASIDRFEDQPSQVPKLH